MVASGTSTPTSITVVATRTWVSPAEKRAMARIFIGALHAAMHEVDALAKLFAQLLEACLGRGEVDLFGFIHQGTDPIGALALAERTADSVFNFFETGERNGTGVDRLTARGFFA